MHAHEAVYLSLLLLSTLVSAAVTWATWLRRNQSGARPLLCLGIALAILSVSSAMESLTPTLPAKEMWVNIQYLGYATTPVLYLLMVMQYLGIGGQWSPRNLAVLMLIPALTIIFAWTNDHHHLIRDDLYLESTGFLSFLGKTPGPWWWVHLVYALLLMVISVGMLLHPRLHTHACFRMQTRALLFGILIPLISSILYALGIGLSPGMDLTPALASFTGLLIVVSLLRYRLFDYVPIARDQVVESMSDGMLVLDRHFRLLDLNRACAHMLGINAGDVLGMPLTVVLANNPTLCALLTAPDPAERSEYTADTPEGTRHWEVRLSPLSRHYHPWGRLALFHDITNRKQADQVIRHMAFHDRLTDLPNRELFQQHVDREIAHARRRQERLAVLVLDLDDFKTINDTLGHFYGDRVLCEAANRLRGVVRESDALCRLGGDEFVILQTEVAAYDSARELAHRIYAALSEPMQIENHTIHISTSIGISLYPNNGTTLEELLRCADDSMYIEKRQKKQYAHQTAIEV